MKGLHEESWCSVQALVRDGTISGRHWQELRSSDVSAKQSAVRLHNLNLLRNPNTYSLVAITPSFRDRVKGILKHFVISHKTEGNWSYRCL